VVLYVEITGFKNINSVHAIWRRLRVERSGQADRHRGGRHYGPRGSNLRGVFIGAATSSWWSARAQNVEQQAQTVGRHIKANVESEAIDVLTSAAMVRSHPVK